MCLFPISIKTVDAFNLPVNQSVPCGKCIECLKDRQNSWKIRLTEEARDHLYIYFFTLTYNDSSVPHVFYNGEQINHVCKSDIQSWIKRNRIRYERYFKRAIDFKYFVCSEYGPNTGRPHYHGIIFTDISPTFISSMFADWSASKGFTNFSEVGKRGAKKVSRQSLSAVSNYVAKYCLKPSQLLTDSEKRIFELTKQGIIPASFYLMSKGIGKSYVVRMKRYHVPKIANPRTRITTIVDRSVYHDGSYTYKLPRFYRDRLYRQKFPCDSKVWNKNKKQYENKIVYRYKSKNLLSLQIQGEVRNRLLDEYARRCSELRFAYPRSSDTEIALAVQRSDEAAKIVRFRNTATKMSRFYNTNRFKNRKF